MKQSPFGSKITAATAAIATGTGTTTTLQQQDTKLERNMENATEGLSSQYFNLLHRMLPANRDNVLTICDYIKSLKSEINLSDHYRADVIELLCKFSAFFNNNDKCFKDITRKDLLSFLDSFRKIDSADPLHKWIGTYNTYRIQLMCFFKWLYSPSPDIEQKKRPKHNL